MLLALFLRILRRSAKTVACVLAVWSFAPSARATPLEGTWVGVEESLSPAGAPHAYRVGAHAGQFTIAYDCGATRCTATLPAIEFAPGQYVSGGFSPPGPYRLFIFVPNPDCRTRYGASAFLGAWSDTGSAPYTTECFALFTSPFRPSGRLPRVYPPLRTPHFNIPPNLQRPQLTFPSTGPNPPPPPEAHACPPGPPNSAGIISPTDSHAQAPGPPGNTGVPLQPRGPVNSAGIISPTDSHAQAPGPPDAHECPPAPLNAGIISPTDSHAQAPGPPTSYEQTPRKH